MKVVITFDGIAHIVMFYGVYHCIIIHCYLFGYNGKGVLPSCQTPNRTARGSHFKEKILGAVGTTHVDRGNHQ